MKNEEYGKKLVKKHLPEWDFEFHQHIKALGRTSHRHKIISIHKSLSKTQNPYVIKNILKHEIAHAKSSREGHGKTWEKEMQKLKAAKWITKRRINIVQTGDRKYIQELGDRRGRI